MLRTDYTALEGGLDLVSRPITKPPGRAIAALNYEPGPTGYSRIDGFERFDGQPKPSEASYWVLNFDVGRDEISEGDTVDGFTSGAAGVALIDAVVESGSYDDNDAAGYLVLTGVSGTFQNSEVLKVGGVTKSHADGVATEHGASTDAEHNTWLQDAIETARALIGTVPGSGAIRGIWMYNTVVYAFRDNSGGTAGVMHKATSSGWTAVSLGNEISFDAGTAEFAEGETLTGAMSGATATINRIIVESGDWSTNDADGYLILGAVTSGPFQNNETITSASGSATADGANSAITLSAGGTYRFRNHNFFGASDLERMYGVNGVDQGFEFDGSVFVPIRTGMTTDTPSHLAIQKNHLFFAFPGGSLQNSGTGDPYAWSPILGASEIGIGSDVTGLAEDTDGPMAILARFKRGFLYGNDNTDWTLITLGDDAGAVNGTLQRIGQAVYMDDLGIRGLRATNDFGNFRMTTLSQLVEPLFKAKRLAGTLATASMRIRSKDQYRVFFDDGTGLTVYFGRKYPEIMPFNLGKTVRFAAACECEVSDGEHLFFGSDDGYVYQHDAGTSFDGSSVEALLILSFNHVGSPTRNKAWKKVTMELEAAVSSQISVTSEFDYAAANQPASGAKDFTLSGGGGFWDDATWEDFSWDGAVVGLAEAPIPGFGTNVSIGIYSNETYSAPHSISGYTLHYAPRGLKR